MNHVIQRRTRPERFTEFLSHIFPTERDKLYFELMMEGCCLGFGNERVQSKHIELVMPNNKFFLRLDPLYVVEIFNDGNTAEEILEDKIDDSSPIVVDLCDTGKSKNKQLNFINIICGRKYKTNKQNKKDELNTNAHVFAVRKSLYKDNGNFRSYTLTDYNDDDYNFTEDERDDYEDYIRNLARDIRMLYIKYRFRYDQLDEVIDLYYKELDKIEQNQK
jgi:hypothetical protein